MFGQELARPQRRRTPAEMWKRLLPDKLVPASGKLSEFMLDERDNLSMNRLIEWSAERERKRIAEELTKRLDHTKLSCNVSCIAHKQIQYIYDLKD
jgi:hypothetical protein